MKCYVIKTSYGSESIRSLYHDTVEELDKYLEKEGDTRISPIFDVDFPLLSDNAIVESQVRAIDNLINAKEGKHFAEIQLLRQRKQELLAITFQDAGNE
jgi:hypothetical protein